jgi:hypothetical protein
MVNSALTSQRNGRGPVTLPGNIDGVGNISIQIHIDEPKDAGVSSRIQVNNSVDSVSADLASTKQSFWMSSTQPMCWVRR